MKNTYNQPKHINRPGLENHDIASLQTQKYKRILLISKTPVQHTITVPGLKNTKSKNCKRNYNFVKGNVLITIAPAQTQ